MCSPELIVELNSWELQAKYDQFSHLHHSLSVKEYPLYNHFSQVVDTSL